MASAICFVVLFNIFFVGAVLAGEAPTNITAGVDVGAIWRIGGNGDIWKTGTAAGVSGVYALNSIVGLGGRFGVNHLSYDELKVLPRLVPANTTALAEQSTGQLQILEFNPFVRFSFDRLLNDKLGMFVTVGGGLAYVKAFALSEVEYTSGGRSKFNKFEVNDSEWNAAVTASMGFSYPINETSWIEIVPAYRGIVEGGDNSSFAGLSLAYRIEI